MSTKLTRRHFLLTGAAAGVAFSATRKLLAVAAVPERKFYAILSLGRLGFQGTFLESVELATKHGFEGLDPDIKYFASLSDDSFHRLLDDLQKKNLKFGSAGLPVEFRKDSETFYADLKKTSGRRCGSQASGHPAGQHLDHAVQRRSYVSTELSSAHRASADVCAGAGGS
jgi:hypothetical protein